MIIIYLTSKFIGIFSEPLGDYISTKLQNYLFSDSKVIDKMIEDKIDDCFYSDCFIVEILTDSIK